MLNTWPPKKYGHSACLMFSCTFPVFPHFNWIAILSSGQFYFCADIVYGMIKYPTKIANWTKSARVQSSQKYHITVAHLLPGSWIF